MTVWAAPNRTSGCVGGHPVTAERRHIADGLDKVGLALAVEAHERCDTRSERQLRDGIRAEVDEREVTDVHGPAVTCLGRISVAGDALGAARRVVVFLAATLSRSRCLTR
jgi:hypothetical protein